MKITDYEKVQELAASNIFLLDGSNGTKTIAADALAKALIGLLSSKDFIGGVNLSELTQINKLVTGNKLLVGTTDGNKAIAAEDALFAMLDSFAPVELRRVIFRGKNLGTALTAVQKAAIKDASFKGMFLGDYWNIGGRIWRIVDMDYWYNCGDTAFTSHHLVIMPDEALYNAQMNTTNVTTGGYVGSEMYKKNLENAKTIVNAAFQGSVLTHREYLCNAVANGRPSGGAWFDSSVELPNEPMMYGHLHFSPTSDGSTVPSKWKESTQKFMMNFLRYIFEIQDDLINRTLQNGPTQEFELHERGRIRPITSIQIRDRIVRHSLCDEVLLPEVRKHIIYDNCASIKGRGISQQRKRFEIHLHKYYQLYGNDGYILFGDFSKFYDNIIHEIAKRELLKLFNDDEFIDWLLTLIFKGFQIDVSYMSDEEYETCMIDTFNKLEYRNIPKEKLTGEKWMEKSVNIGDQLSQVIGIYYPYPIDNYVKYVRQQKFYGRYMDDWYIMNPSKEELENLLENVCKIAAELGIHINRKKTRIVKISSKYKFLQIKYTLTDTGKVIKRINPDRDTAMRRKLKKLAVKVENEEADYDNVENMFRGWMGGHYKLLSREQRKNLIQLYEDLFSKEITIVNKKLIVSDRSA